MATLENGKSNDFTFEAVLKGNVPYPLSLLEDFAKKEYSEENVQFYRSVEAFKEAPKLNTRDDIVDLYVLEGGEKEVNIPGDYRVEIVQRKAEETEPKADLFDKAQKEVSTLVYNDTYPRFKKMVRETNLNDVTAAEAKALGLRLLFSAIVVTGVIFGLQVACEPSVNATVPPFCSSLLKNRFWRLVSAPFWFGGIMFVLAGRQKLCPICAASAATFGLEKPNKSYFAIITGKLLPDYVVKAPEVLRANRQRARRSMVFTLTFTVLILVAILLAPPDYPQFYT